MTNDEAVRDAKVTAVKAREIMYHLKKLCESIDHEEKRNAIMVQFEIAYNGLYGITQHLER